LKIHGWAGQIMTNKASPGSIAGLSIRMDVEKEPSPVQNVQKLAALEETHDLNPKDLNEGQPRRNLEPEGNWAVFTATASAV
jgi:hypothetical protein